MRCSSKTDGVRRFDADCHHHYIADTQECTNPPRLPLEHDACQRLQIIAGLCRQSNCKGVLKVCTRVERRKHAVARHGHGARFGHGCLTSVLVQRRKESTATILRAPCSMLDTTSP